MQDGFIGSRLRRHRLQPYGDLAEAHGQATAKVKHGGARIAGIHGDEARGIRRHRQRMHVACLEMLVAGLCAASQKDAEKKGAHGFSG